MKTLLAWLFGFFVLAVADPQGDLNLDVDADAGDADADVEADTSEADADVVDAGDADADADVDAAAAKIAADAKALKDAQDENARIRADLEAARAERRAAPGLSDEQRVHEQEEAKLRDAKTTELERWQINSNRTLRENKRQSSAALFQAQELSDRTAFNQLAMTQPAIHKRYAERVETQLKTMRATGQNAPREAILRFLVGDDAIKGALTSKKGPAKADVSTIDRGRSPGARSDVAGRGRLTESQKREKRLEGVQL